MFSPCLHRFPAGAPASSHKRNLQLIGYSKFPVGVNVCATYLSLNVGPVMNMQTVQVVPHLRPMSAGIGSSPP